MGVTGLLPFVREASAPATVQHLKSCGINAAAVDAYCWLHRAAAAVAGPSGIVPGALVKYCLTIINMLLSHDIKPVMVFDGRHLPAKAGTEDKRREARKLAKKRASEYLQLGRVDEAKKYIRQSIDITHGMALELIKECRKMNVDCIVAPYEADAQLAYLNKINIVQVVITEDSDLILFGCTKVLFKMDTSGGGMLYERSKLPIAMKTPIEKFNFEKFRQMCILSGCDYLPSLPGIGLAKAKQFINATRDPDIGNAIKKIPSYFNKTQLQVSEEYCDGFLKAEATFKHQLVYDPLKRMMVPLIEIDDEGTDPKYCTNAGEYLDNEIAFQLALGNLDPFNLKTMDNWNPDDPNNKPTGTKTNRWNQKSIAPHKSMWSKEYYDHLNYNVGVKKVNAISFPSTKPLQAKIINLNSNNMKVEEGLTIEDLSAMYCEEPPVKRIKTDSEKVEDTSSSSLENDDIKSSGKTSPILLKNPRNHKRLMEARNFNKLKQFSKFQRTTLDENNLVHSRFFDSPECSDEIKVEDVNMSIESNASIRSESIIDLDMDDKTDENTSPPSILHEFQKTVKSSFKNPFKKQEAVISETPLKESLYIAESIITPPNSNPQSEMETEEMESVVLTSFKAESKIINCNSMVTKNGCKRIGLNKKSFTSSSSLVNQQTLLTKFGFLKKTQLKH